MQERVAHRYPAVDGLRALAMVSVVAFHAWFGAAQPHLDGGIGRDVVASGFLWFELFFLISGFVLFVPVAQREGRLDVRRFYVARAARVLPLWWFVLLVISIVGPLATKFAIPAPWTGDGFKLYLANATLLHLPFYGLPAGGLFFDVVVWTLSIEVVFYILMPLVAPLVLRWPVAVAAVGVVLSRGWVSASTRIEQWWPSGWIPHHDATGVEVARAHASAQFPTYAGHFAIGMALATLIVRRGDAAWWQWLRRHADLVLLAGLVEVVVTMAPAFRAKARGDWTLYDNSTRTGVALPGLVLIFVGVVLAGPWCRRILGNPVMVLIGTEVVYGLYLWHVFLMDLTTYAFGWASDGSMGIFVVRLAVIPMAVAVAVVGRIVIEKPAITWARRFATPRVTGAHRAGETPAVPATAATPVAPRGRRPLSELRARRLVLSVFGLGLALRLALVCRPLVALDRQFMPDDTYYTLGIARSLGHGHGPAIQGVRTSGFQPLLAFVLAPVSTVTGRDGLLRVAVVLLVVCDALCILLLARLAWRLGGPVAAVAAASLWALSPVAMQVAGNGLETSLALLTSLALVEGWCWARESRQPWAWPLVGVLAGLVILSRVDLMLLVLALGGMELLRGGWRQVATAVPATVAVLAPWWGWCWATFGSPLPESGSAVRQLVLLHRSLLITQTRSLGLAGGEVIGGPVADLRGLRDWIFTHGPAGLLIFGVVMAAIAAFTVWTLRRGLSPVAALGVQALGLLVFYGSYLNAPWFYRRYLHVSIAVVTLLLAVLVARGVSTETWRRPAVWLTGFALAIGGVLSVGQIVRSPADSADTGYNGVEGYREVARTTLAQVPPGSVLGSMQSGALSYYAPPGVRVVNLDGVVDADAARAVRRKELSQFVTAQGITLFADWQFNADTVTIRFTKDPASRVVLTPITTGVPQAGDHFVLYRVTDPKGSVQ